MFARLCICFLIVGYSMPFISSEESQFSINNNKALQQVNEKFISFSVDPAMFFTRLPHRDILFKLITHLSPAYLRIAGPSTQFLDFSVDERKATRIITDASTSLSFSPDMWWKVNEWMQKTNFTPIFGINDARADGGNKWDPKEIVPFLDMTEKMNINCLWQIGFDCSEKGFEQYKQDLKSFRRILDEFPNKKDKWKIVGSDLSKCTPSDHPEILRMYLADLDDADAIVWEEDESIISNFLSSGVMEKLLGFHQATVPIWLSTPKTQHPIGFEDGINWAIEIGEAARKGFAIIFREPRIQEYFSTTPTYWVTVLHKALMGRNVLDVKSSSLSHSDARIYAHCARDQNSFSVRGALALMIVNNGTQAHRAAFRIPTQIKSVEVRSYILTTMDNTTDIFLNNEKLTLDSFKLLPKLRRAKVLSHLMLTAPAKSIAFFVLPSAKIPICIDSEDDMALILEEIDRIQAVDFADSAKSVDGLLSRLNAPRVSMSLSDLHRKLQEEFKTDATVVPKLKLKSQILPKGEWKQFSEKIAQRAEPNPINTINPIKNFNFLLDKTKPDIKPIKVVEFKNLLKKDNEKKDDILGNVLLTTIETNPNKAKYNDLNLSSSEVFKILEDRAKAKMDKRMGFTDFEFDLDNILEKAFKSKFRRDINMKLLEEKVHNQEVKAFKPLSKQKKQELSDDSTGKEIKGLPDKSIIIPGFSSAKAKSASESSPFGSHGFPKLHLFQSSDKLDFSSLLSLLGSKTPSDQPETTTPSTETTTTQREIFMRRPDLSDEHEFDQQFHELEDDLYGESFYDNFGDSISMQPMESSGGDNSFLSREFIVNDGDVSGAIKKLENYFNQSPKTNMKDNFEPAFDSFEDFGRFKRGIRDFIHRVRQGSIGNHLRIKTPARNWLRGRSRVARSAESKPANQLTPARNTIIKKYKSQIGKNEWKPEDLLKLPQFHTVYSVNDRKDQISFKDIPKSRSTFGLENARRINIRKARRVRGGIDLMENTIDDFFNNIEKETQFIKPLLNKAEGDYTIILPTHEKISVLQDKNGDAEIVLHRDGGSMSVQTGKFEEADNQVDDSTCAATDIYSDSNVPTFANDANAAITQEKNEDAVYDIKHGAPEKRVNRSDYVQKIPYKSRHQEYDDQRKPEKPESDNKYNLSFVTNIMNSFSKFMKKLHNKMDTFFKAVE